jgi:hypothetical protein
MMTELSAEEQAQAVELAIGERGARPLVVEPIISERRRRQGERHAVVAQHDRASGASVVTAVDLGQGEVIGQHTTPAQFQLTAEEEREAAEFALADPRIADFLRGRPANPLTRLYFPPGEWADRTHRFAIVFLRPTTDERRYAVVDLTEGNVAEVLRPEQLFTG